jgi:hypothetical protein
MKPRYYLLFAASLLLSCNESFLDVVPKSDVSGDNFYRNATDFRNAVNAAYSFLQKDALYGDNFSSLAEVPADNVTVADPSGAGGAPQATIDAFVTPTTNSLVLSVYTGSYAGIQRCNIVLERIGSATIADNLKNQFTGEVSFLRALHYFNLVRLFGDVPLVLNEVKNAQEGYGFGRVPVEQVYTQILADLAVAEAKLPLAYTGADIGRATQGAAKSLLGKVYLTRKAYAQAAAKLKEVIDLGGTGTGKVYDLAPAYADNFNPTKSNNAGHKESIFEVQYKTGGIGEGSPWTNRVTPAGITTAVTGIGPGNGTFLWPTPQIANAYARTDLRRAVNLDSARIVGVFRTYVKKYVQTVYGSVQFAAYDGDPNWPLLRYADVLLMYAEALNEVNGGPNALAYDAINRVRRRAYGVPVATPSATVDVPAGLTKAQFFTAVEAERRLELAFEGHRWFDLVRTDRAIPVMSALGYAIKPRDLLFPIPQAEIDINPRGLTQNPGY